MSTYVKSTLTSRRLYILAHPNDAGVYVGVLDQPAREFGVGMSRTDFLAAVASELNVRIVPADAIVIERSELPAVLTEPGAHTASIDGLTVYFQGDTAASARTIALRWLAAAEYLAANPGPDASQVAAVQAVLDTIDAADFDDLTLAARLVQNGVRVEVTK